MSRSAADRVADPALDSLTLERVEVPSRSHRVYRQLRERLMPGILKPHQRWHDRRSGKTQAGPINPTREVTMREQVSQARSSAGAAAIARRAALLLTAPLLAGFVGAALPAYADETPLVIARAMDINSLDPARTWCDTCQIYVSNVYETLIGLAADNKTLTPRLATSWEASDDQSQLTFHLDADALFSDGSPIEAKDVKWSWERLKNIKGGPSFMMDGVKSIEAPDAHTVVVTMKAPNSEILGILTAPYTAVVNSDVAAANGANANADADQSDTSEPWFMANSAGSGPYVLASYKADDELRFMANPNYKRGKVGIKEIVIKHTKDAIAQAQLLESGGADVAMQIDPDTAKTIKSDNVSISTVP
ncbi:MAG: ABC transporter substrate-binding protein, partial [Rhodospirillales bacterium]|nr:ABC transporter substrate-binding protein [Rhodospirillales bacterium]